MEFILDVPKIEQTIREALKIDTLAFYNDVGKIMLNAVSENFLQEGSYFGDKWRPLASSTIKERKRLGFVPINILRRRAGDAGLLGSINYSATSTGVTIGSNLYYALYLQMGTKKMPARPFLPTTDLPQEVIDDIAEAYMRLLNN